MSVLYLIRRWRDNLTFWKTKIHICLSDDKINIYFICVSGTKMGFPKMSMTSYFSLLQRKNFSFRVLSLIILLYNTVVISVHINCCFISKTFWQKACKLKLSGSFNYNLAQLCWRFGWGRNIRSILWGPHLGSPHNPHFTLCLAVFRKKQHLQSCEYGWIMLSYSEHYGHGWLLPEDLKDTLNCKTGGMPGLQLCDTSTVFIKRLLLCLRGYFNVNFKFTKIWVSPFHPLSW